MIRKIFGCLGCGWLALVAGLGLLGAPSFWSWMARDDADNPPIKGDWHVETRVTSMAVNSLNFGREAVIANGGASMIEEVERSVERECFEPNLAQAAELAEFVGSRFGSCTAEQGDEATPNTRIALACTRDAQSARLVIDGQIEAESGQLAITAAMTEPSASGAAPKSFTLRMTQQWRRTADCS